METAKSEKKANKGNLFSDCISVVFSCDDNYFQHLYCAIVSMICNKKDSDIISIYILIENLCDKNKKLLQELCDTNNIGLCFVKVRGEDFKACPITQYCSHISIATYYRFVLARILPKLDKVLYLDCDITIQGSLRELFDTDIEDFYFGAVKDILFESNTERLGIKKYCNAGIMLINLKKWREENIEFRLFDWMTQNIRKIKWVDQDVLNCVLQDKIKYIDKKWNAQVGQYKLCEDFNKMGKEAKILHHIAMDKPWSNICNSPLKFVYFKYLLKTPYAYKVPVYIFKQIFIPTLERIKKILLAIRTDFEY